MAIIVNPMVSKNGLGTFVTTKSTPAASGYYDYVAITAKGGDAVFKVNGVIVPMGPAKVELQRGDNASLEYQLQCGSVSLISMGRGALTSYTAPTATADSASVAKGLVLGSGPIPLAQGVLAYTNIVGGSGYPAAFFAQVTGGNPIFPAGVLGRASGGVVTSLVPYTGSWTGHGTGYAGTFTGGLVGVPGSGCSFTAVVGNYIEEIPVDDPGSGMLVPPVITINDSTGTGAVARPIMSGPAASDTVTYSAPADWITCGTFGSPDAVVDAAVFNYVGRMVGPCYSLPGFQIPPTMQVGLNHPPQATYNQHSHLMTCKDKMFTHERWTGPSLQVDNNLNPVSWTAGGQLDCSVYQDVFGYYDMVHDGPWTIKYRDAFHAGTTTATTAFTLTAGPRYTFGTPTQTVVGDVVTITYPSTFNWVPGNFADANIRLQWTSSDGLNHVTHPNNANMFRPLVMGPGETDNGIFHDASDYIIANLVRNGVSPSWIRMMDLYFGYAGASNYSVNADRMPADLSTWSESPGSSAFGQPDYVQGYGKVVTFEFAHFTTLIPPNLRPVTVLTRGQRRRRCIIMDAFRRGRMLRDSI